MLMKLDLLKSSFSRLLSFRNAASVLVFVCLSACQTSETGIGVSASVSPSDQGAISSQSVDDGIDVLILDFPKALSLAFEIAQEISTAIGVTYSGESVAIVNSSYWRGDVKGIIDPVLIRNKNTNEVGVTFEITMQGVGVNAAMDPGYFADRFYSRLAEVVESRGLKAVKFLSYERMVEKGLVDYIAASVPTGFDEFIRYIDQKEQRDQFEGVWQDDSSAYTMGLVRDDRDFRFPYKAFVLETEQSNWKPGQVKIKFSSLERNGLAIARYHMANKAEYGVTFQVHKRALTSITKIMDTSINLLQIYPRGKAANISSGSGTAWYVGEGFFVTNAHVVSGAREITLTIGAVDHSARVALIDTKLDLAVVRVTNDELSLVPLPLGVATDPGEQVTVVGFPLGATLGQTAKVTTGVVSNLFGVQDDPTNMQISAPVQPGNSGGPVFGESGNVIGVVVAKLRNEASSDGDVEAVNFAIKSEYLLPLIQRLNIPKSASGDTFVSSRNICEKYCGSIVSIKTE